MSDKLPRRYWGRDLEGGNVVLTAPTGDRILSDHRFPALLTTANVTLTKDTPRHIIMDPMEGGYTITLPDPTLMRDAIISFEMRHGYNGTYGLMANGNCESTSPPLLDGTSAYTSNATWARDAGPSVGPHSGSYCYKFTASSAALAAAGFVDNVTTTDMHGLTARGVYTLKGWLYVPTTGGPPAVDDVYGSSSQYLAAWRPTEARVSHADKWLPFSDTMVLHPNSTGTHYRMEMNSGVGSGDYVYVDDVSFFHHNRVIIAAPSGFQIEERSNFACAGLNARGALYSDGGKWKLLSWSEEDMGSTSSASGVDGSEVWRRRDRTLEITGIAYPWSNGGYVIHEDYDEIVRFVRATSDTNAEDFFQVGCNVLTQQVVLLGPNNDAGAYTAARHSQYNDRFQMLDGTASFAVSWMQTGSWIGDV